MFYQKEKLLFWHGVSSEAQSVMLRFRNAGGTGGSCLPSLAWRSPDVEPVIKLLQQELSA